MNETDELYDRIHELAETSKELMGLQRELERQRTINKTIAHDMQSGHYWFKIYRVHRVCARGLPLLRGRGMAQPPF